jgi:hypothetical protein
MPARFIKGYKNRHKPECAENETVSQYRTLVMIIILLFLILLILIGIICVIIIIIIFI